MLRHSQVLSRIKHSREATRRNNNITSRTFSTLTRPANVFPRSVWKRHQQKEIPLVNGATTKTKMEGKPWPQSMQIAAALAACTAIPYLALWLISANQRLRDMFASYISMNWLRKHFGEIEMDGQSYVDRDDNNNDTCYKFVDEATLPERMAEDAIVALERQPTSVTIHPVTSGVVGGDSSKKVLPASTILSAVPSGQDSGYDADNNSWTALDLSFENTTDGDYTEMENELDDFASGRPKRLYQKTNESSSWFKMPAAAAREQAAAKTLSETDVEISRLTHLIESLVASKKDPLTPKSMDEIDDEIAESKARLSRLKWRKFFGR